MKKGLLRTKRPQKIDLHQLTLTASLLFLILFNVDIDSHSLSDYEVNVVDF